MKILSLCVMFNCFDVCGMQEQEVPSSVTLNSAQITQNLDNNLQVQTNTQTHESVQTNNYLHILPSEVLEIVFRFLCSETSYYSQSVGDRFEGGYIVYRITSEQPRRPFFTRAVVPNGIICSIRSGLLPARTKSLARRMRTGDMELYTYFYNIVSKYLYMPYVLNLIPGNDYLNIYSILKATNKTRDIDRFNDLIADTTIISFKRRRMHAVCEYFQVETSDKYFLPNLCEITKKEHAYLDKLQTKYPNAAKVIYTLRSLGLI